MECTKDCVLYKEGMDANRVFIVKEGEFEVTKDWIVQSDKEEDVRTI